jgi:predicted ATPase/class 3 adenylate cyclase
MLAAAHGAARHDVARSVRSPLCESPTTSDACAMSDLPTGTVTFLFTDVEASTRLLREYGEAYPALLGKYRRLLREAFRRHGGVEVDTQGDAFFYAFGRASDALAAAEEGHAALERTPVRVRMGVHTGEPVVTDDGYVGIDVHKAARIASAAHGGQILLSEQTARLVDNDGLNDIGLHRLKDLAVPERLYQLGPSAFPPPRTLYPVNLPSATAALVGREREFVELVELLRARRFVTVTGAGGIGKTRLALEAALAVVDDFPDGVHWVPLEGLFDAELLLPSIASVLAAGPDIADHVGDKRMLLVLDNLEHLLPAAALPLAELSARCPNLALLATSRAAIRVTAEREYALGPLAAADAAALFRDLAANAEPFEAVVAICERLDGVPLAVELAAARTRILSPEKLLQRLSNALPLLTGGARDAAERQRTLAATIAWSHDLLSADEQRLFARLAVFVGGFEVEAAEEVCGADLDALEHLVEKSLVTRADRDRIGMLQVIREYALERLDASGEAEDLRRRHAEYFLALATADSAIPRHREAWLDRVQRDHDNLHVALDWTAAAGRVALERRLAASLWPFWHVRGHYRDALARLERAILSSGERDEVWMQLAKGLVVCATRVGELERAEHWAGALLDVSRATDDDRAIANALQASAYVAGERDDGRAADLLELALRHATRAGDELLLAKLTGSLGRTLASSEKTRARGLELLREGLARCRAVGDRESEAMLSWALTHAALTDGNVAEGRRLLEQTLTVVRELRFMQPLPGLLLWLATILVREGSIPEAVALVGTSEMLVAETGRALDREERARLEHVLSAAARSMHIEDQEALLRAGRGTTTDEAIESALATLQAN